MPSLTPRQHRAMEAAAHGKSTLGIPQSVGREFARADGDRSFGSGGSTMKTFPIPSAPAPSGGEDKPKAYAKGGNVGAASYAEGGAVLGRVRNFMKEPDEFRDDRDHPTPPRRNMPEDQDYAKSGKGEKGKDKSMKPVMPRK